MLRLPGRRLPCGDDADDLTLAPVAVTNQRHAKRTAEPQQDKSALVFRMVRIINQARLLVEKNRLRLLEGNAMFSQVGCGLAIVPFEFKGAHSRSVVTT